MKTTQVLSILKIAAWIIYIGLCIQTGAMIISLLMTLFGNPEGAKDLYRGMDLSELYAFDKWHFIFLMSFVIIISASKAHMFYRVIKIFSKINLTHPFSQRVANLISNISGIAMGIGIFSFLSNNYAQWLMKKGLNFSYESGGTEFLFLAGILFVIAQIFKRGIELQSENELTI